MTEDIYPNRNRKPRWRGPLRKAMKEAGVPAPRRQWIWSVMPGAIDVPQWALKVAVRGLGEQDGRVWLWPTDAKKLFVEDSAAGGMPQLNIAEVRYCKVCWRPLIGSDAENRRELDESGPGGRKLPCGETCFRDNRTGVWRKLVYGREVRQDEVA